MSEDDRERDKSDKRQRNRSFAVRGDYLRSLRLARGWTQQEAAARTEVTDRLIRKAESGGPLQAKTISALAMLYCTPELRLEPEQLLMESEGTKQVVPAGSSLAERVQRWFDAQWVSLDLTVIVDLSVPNFVFHTEGGTIHGPAGMKARVLELRQSFSDIEMLAEEVLDMGEAVAVRWRATITHTGPWLGLAPTGRRVSVPGSSWVEMVGDKFGEAWDFWDPGVLYQQLTAK
jgi:transcriptional regulator with XRE-family HTH domain